MSYTFLAGGHLDNSTATNTFTLNLGSGTKFFIVGVFAQNGAPVAGISINGTALSPIVDNTVGTAIWAGTASALGTGSDLVLCTGTGSLAFGDNCIQIYTASGLSSNTPFSFAFGGAGVTTVTVAAVVGYFAFGFIGNNPAVNFTGSAQVPTGTPATQTGANGNALVAGDWVLTSTGVVGGNFTITASGNVQTCVAVWAVAPAVSTTAGIIGLASAEW